MRGHAPLSAGILPTPVCASERPVSLRVPSWHDFRRTNNTSNSAASSLRATHKAAPCTWRYAPQVWLSPAREPISPDRSNPAPSVSGCGSGGDVCPAIVEESDFIIPGDPDM